MTLRVVHTFGRNAGAVQSIDKDVVRFGRSPDNEVAFDPEYDRDASGHHAEAKREGASWVLVDKSRNGTFVGGQRIERHVLQNGDEVTFGKKGPRVRIELAQAAAQAPPKPAAEIARAPVGNPPQQVQARPAPVAPQPQQPPQARPAPVAAQPQHQAHHAAQPSPSLQAAYRPAPAAGARVGQKTMAQMISSAVAAATGRSRPRKTFEISAMVEEHVSAATAGQRRSMATLGFFLVVALVGLGAVIFYGRKSEDEIDSLRSDLATLPPGDPRRKEIEGRLGTLHPSNANFGRNLYDQSKKGIFMLASGGQGFCTAFAVRSNVLATNAHCIVAARKQGGRVVALENEGHGQTSFSVSDMRTHPAYRDTDETSLSPDVGIVTIAGQSAVVLQTATAAELQAAGAGDDIYLIGFPGRLMDASNPAATFLAANIGRITDASGRPGAFANAWLLQHDATTTRGTSGSPIFNGQGKVIAINAGGYLEGDDQTIAGKKTEVVKESPYKFGMRIDLLSAILR